MALKRITEVTIISSSDVTETPHTFIEHDGAFYRIDSENFQRVFLGGVFRDLEAIIAEDFSTSSTYDVGDLAIYDNKLYECTTAIATAGSWDSTKWTELDLATKITTDKSLALRDRPADAKTVGDAIASTALQVVDPNNDGHLEFVPLADEWSDEFLEDSVVEATENWLEEHVSSGDIVVDDTLSISGAAGDKKAYDNIAIGKAAVHAGSEIKKNIGIGSSAMSYNTETASENVSIGDHSGTYASNGNTHVGTRAGYYNKGDYNTSLGHAAGSDLYNTGDNNICIGHSAGIKDPTATSSDIKTINNSIAIGYNVKATKSNQAKFGNSDQEIVLGDKKIIFNLDGTVTWEAL